MPVTTQHRQYSAVVAKWKRCRDAYSGSDAIKDAGEAYLPKLGAQTDPEYKAYKTRALWYGATKRTVQGLSGAVMRKEAAVTVKNEELKQDLENVTLTGVGLPAFAKTVIEETLQVGRCGVLCDMSDDATIHATERRPYWSFYAAEAIKNWHTEIRGGVPVLVKVVLYEESEQQKGQDEFDYECKPQYRVLKLNAEGNYEVQVYRKASGSEASKDGEWIGEEATIPQRRGAPLKYIPFVFINPTSVTPDIEDPPLIDLVDVNLSHYLTSADLEHGRHFCGLPTVWATGIPTDTTMKVGSSVVLTASDPMAKFGILEFTGKGLGALETGLENKERQMAVLGARLLEQQKPAVESNDTIVTRTAGERSILQSLCQTISQALTQVLKWHAEWKGDTVEEDMAIALNQDFVNAEMPTDLLLALLQAVQSGNISWETFYFNLEKGEITRPGVDAETEKALIEEQNSGNGLLDPETEAMVNAALAQKRNGQQPPEKQSPIDPEKKPAEKAA